MKLFATISAITLANTFKGQNVKRQITGDFVPSKLAARGTLSSDEDTFRTLAIMMAYASGWGTNSASPGDQSNFETELTRLENKYTNYGCYCWIDGVDAGVIGGGKVKDFTDFQCKELYRCYKCVNIDYAANYTEVEYNAELTTDSHGNRVIDCSGNGQQDSENICECDKRFAEKIAKTEKDCAIGITEDAKKGALCLDEQYRTVTGNRLDNGNLGTFDSRTMCEKNFPDHHKDKCCGLYPNRNPYDSSISDCCQTENPLTGAFEFRKTKAGVCADLGGSVVVSEEGNPHSYFQMIPGLGK